MRHAEPPTGYVELTVGSARVVCLADVADAVHSALREGTLYEYASRHPRARSFAGRGISYAVPLPGNADNVVVRHNRHGGLLASLTGDLFRSPTRAPLELRVSTRLREVGVPTPIVVGYAIYPAAAGFERADVMTREVSHSADLSTALLSDDARLRQRALRATGELIATLDRAGARHHDLNVKNVLLRETGDAIEAMALDVDRVTFGHSPESVIEANLARLVRSARKWQSIHHARVTEAELDEFARSVRDRSPAYVDTLS